MALQNAKRDQNHIPAISGVTDDANLHPRTLKVDPVTDRLKVTGTISESVLPTGASTSAIQTNGTQIARAYMKTGDATFQVPRLDYPTHTLQTIDYAHHEIHVGSHYFVSGVQTLSQNQVLDFTWTMPNTTKWTHWLWKIDTQSETTWYVYENAAVVNALANAVTPLNSDRNSLSVSGTTMKFEVQASLAAANTDTDVTTATLLKSGISGAGKTGGSEMRETELILKQGATYCLRAVATAAGYIDFNMEWYEHTNRTA